jgi:hypothetical protein
MKNKLKILAVSAALVAAFATATHQRAEAQSVGEVTAPATASGFLKVMEFLSTHAELLNTNQNWTFVPYASRAVGLVDDQGEEAEWGGGLAALYPLNNYVRGGFRMQYFAGEWFMPSVNVQLQSSYYLFGTKASWTPFVFTGLASPVGGSQDNGDVGALYGAGLSVKVPLNERWTVGCGYAVESWSNLRVDHVEHFGLVLDFKF